MGAHPTWPGLAAGALLVLAGACSSVDAPATDGPHLAVTVAPLTLTGVTNARYTITVTNGADEVVWTRTVDSRQYGDGAGAVSLVGPCDGDRPAHTVALTLDALEDASGTIPSATYRNPTVPTAVTRGATCAPNADTPVTFDLTVARDASQGFFDVAVSFDDIFCSAKLDCGPTTDPADDIDLLFNGGARDMTAVLGLACTAGPDVATHLYLDDLVIDCGGPLTVVDVGGLGNVDLTAPPSANPSGYLFAAQVSRGAEGLAHKLYWNVALGLDATAFPTAPCHLTTTATATRGPLAGLTTAPGTTYPLLRWDVVLSQDGARTCTEHAVDATPTGVATDYTEGDAGTPFQHATSLPAGCTADAQCDDGDTCTQDTCVAGACVLHDCALAGYDCVGCGQVYTSCSDLVGSGLPDGVYAIDPDGDGGLPPFEVWCDADRGWTLIESFAFANNATVAAADFAQDLPLNPSSPSDHALHRLSLAQIQALEADATEWLATCDLDTSETGDFIRARLDALTPTTFVAPSGSPGCTTVEAARVHGAGCTGCSVAMYQSATIHLTSDVSTGACGAVPWSGSTIASEDDFGYYETPNAALACAATPQSTTNWWLRKRVCQPDTTACQNNAVTACDPTGTVATVVTDCAASGQTCVAGACVTHAATCGELVGQGLSDGVYTIDPDGGGAGLDPFDVWCDLTRGWTLIESFSYANNAQVAAAAFSQNVPKNEATPSNLALHRLSLAKIRALEAASSEWLTTCNLDTSETANFIRADLASLTPSTLTTSSAGSCHAVKAANIRGYGCTDCTVSFWQVASTYHLCTDSTSNYCSSQAPWTSGAVYSEDDFGYYGTVNPALPCVATPASTTNWWLRDLACTPNVATCTGDVVQQCNSTGTLLAPGQNCAASGQVCAAGACEPYAPGTENQPVASCSALTALGLTANGVYWIDADGPDGAPKGPVYCDLAGGWTLVESFSRANAATLTASRFGADQPLNVDAPDTFALHRLPLSRLQALEAISTEWLATCDLDTSETLDFLHGRLSDLSLTGFSGAGTCANVLDANIRGYSCQDCSLPFWQSGTYHLHTDASTASCDALPWNGTALSSEDDFGYYATPNSAFTCMATADSTTQWWLRTRVCEPDAAFCDGDSAMLCNSTGTAANVAQDCALTGESCWQAACAPLPATCADLVGSGEPDAVYAVNPDGPGGLDPFEVWCDATRGWTLFESFAYGNNSQVRVKELGVDAPLNATTPSNHALHRLGLAQVQALEGASSEWMTTCNMDSSATSDFIRAPIATLRPTTFAGIGICKTVTAADIRGHGCTGCSVPFWQGSTAHYHLVTDASVTSCGTRPWTASAVASEDNFGYYGVINTAFPCVATSASTTNWWYR